MASSWCSAAQSLTLGEFYTIARTLALTPSAWVELASESSGAFSFLLPDQSPRHLILKRRATGCVFSRPLADNRSLCGLGSLCPKACQAAPPSVLRPSPHKTSMPLDEVAIARELSARLALSPAIFSHDSELIFDALLSLCAEFKGRDDVASP